MIKFTVRPQFNQAAIWQPSNMKVGNLRVWAQAQADGSPSMLRVGRYGDRYFHSWSQDREPNYI